MKKTMMIIFAVLLFATAHSQNKSTSSKVMTPQDSAAAAQAEANKFLDSLLSKTSLKDFQTFLYETVSGKEYNETPFIRLYDYFLQRKYDQWMQRKQQKKN